MRFWVRVLATGAVSICVLPASAMAKQETKVTLKLPASATAGAATPFAYTTNAVPKGAKVVVQRPEGTGHIWRTIADLQIGPHRASVPALPIGVYTLRLAVLAKRKVTHKNKTSVETVVTAQAVQRLAVFGEVSLSTLLSKVAEPGDFTTPTSVFPFIFSTYDGRVNYTALQISNNPCRAINLQWVIGGPQPDEIDPSQSGAVTLVQESADPVSASSAMGAIAALPVTTLVPGQPWSIRVGQEGPSGGFLFTWYFNGSANCDSTTLSADVDPDGF
jgi:hypothetical protein